MKQHCKAFIAFICLIFVTSLIGCGGGGGGGGVSTTQGDSLSGSVILPTDTSETMTAKIVADVAYLGLKVHLFNVNGTDVVTPADLGSTGLFSFPSVPTGNNYQLVVITPSGKKILRKHLDSFAETKPSVTINTETTAIAILVKQSNYTKSETTIAGQIGSTEISNIKNKISDLLTGATLSTKNDIFEAVVDLIGEAEITRILDGFSNTTNVIKVEGAVLTNATAFIGQTVRLDYDIYPQNATNQSVVWSSGDEAIATVVNGVLTGTGKGKTTIKLTTNDGNHSVTCEVNIKDPYDYFTFDKTTGTITQLNTNGEASITIPDAIDGTSVKTIGAESCQDKQLTSITMPDSITSIGNYAFFNNQLTVVVIPKNVTIIGDHAFENNLLASVKIGDNVNAIGDSAFKSNKLTSVIIPNNVTSIGDSAFCSNLLESLIIGNSVINIGNNAFSNSGGKYDNHIKSITIPDSVTTIGDSAFYRNSLSSLTIPDNVKTIGESAFCGNSLTSLTIGSGLTKIENSVFAYNSLTVLIIPDNITSIGVYAFRSNYLYVKRLTSVSIGKNVTSIGDGAFDENKLSIVTIPDSVINIGDGAFRKNELTKVSFGNSVATIGNEAFHMNKLVSISLPNSLQSIESEAFSYNDLTSIIIPNSVKDIGDQAFYANSLSSITIGSGVTIGNQIVDWSGSFHTGYLEGGAGTYLLQLYTWTKQ